MDEPILNVKTIDEVFEELKPFGLFQKLLTAIALSYMFLATENVWVNVFAYVPEHFCKIDILQNLSVYDQKHIAIPKIIDGHYESCFMYNLNYNSYSFEDFKNWNRSLVTSNETVISKCNEWIFQNETFGNSISTEFKLVCSKRWMLDLISSVPIAGQILGSLTSGYLSDLYGRRKAILFYFTLKILGNTVSIISFNYYIFLFGQFLTRIGMMATYAILCITCSEYIGKNFIAYVILCFAFVQSIGIVGLSGIAFLVQNFRSFLISCTIPQCVILSIFFFIPESPRWLMSRHRINKTQSVLKKIAKINGARFDTACDLSNYIDEKRHSISILTIFKTAEIRRRSLILNACWFTSIMVYYGVSMNANNMMKYNLYINLILLGISDFPFVLITAYAMNKKSIGRKYTFIALFLMTGILNLAIIPEKIFSEIEYIASIFSLLGKSSSCAVYTGLSLYTNELYPTPIRSIGLLMCCSFGLLGGMVAPYLCGSLLIVSEILPFLMFGILSVISALLINMLPETLGKPLPQTLNEIEYTTN